MPAKPARKTPVKSPELQPQAHGGAIRQGGNPGNKGGTGRPPNQLKEFWRQILRGERHQAALKTILENPDHPAFTGVFGKVVVHAEGLPASSEGGEAGDGRPHIYIDV